MHFLVTLVAILASNAIVVSLAPSFSAAELRHMISTSGALVLLSSTSYVSQEKEVSQGDQEITAVYGRVDDMEKGSDEKSQVELTDTSETSIGGMMLFTSGTTAQPKGVFLSAATPTAQAQGLIEAWQYTPDDHLLQVLPLHHIHGIMNVLLTPLLAGSSIEFMFPFNVEAVWKRFAAPFLQVNGINGAYQAKPPISFFTAVPTVRARMIESFSTLSPALQEAGRAATLRKHLRLNISGSAALPQPIHDAWSELSNGNIMLERYGMTEVGMALSCGLEDVDRVENSVG